jgi:hypothetical protein
MMQRLLVAIAVCVGLACSALATRVEAQGKPAIQSLYAEANGVRLHYLLAGKGPPILLLHG